MYEAISFQFNEAATAVVKAELKDIAKWDGLRKAWVMPAGTWANFLELPELGASVHQHAYVPWSEVLPVIEILNAAKVEPADKMPVYKFVGGRVRQIA